MDGIDAFAHSWMRLLKGRKGTTLKGNLKGTRKVTGSDTVAEGFLAQRDTAQDASDDVKHMSNINMRQPTDGDSIATSITAPSPWSDPTYRSFMGVLQATTPLAEGEGAGGGDREGGTYRRLMATESRVLDTVDRVVNDARFVEIRDQRFMHQSIATILDRTALALMDAFTDLMQSKSLDDVVDALSRDERPLYFGLALTAVTVTLIVAGA